jgi:hypothetical protein
LGLGKAAILKSGSSQAVAEVNAQAGGDPQKLDEMLAELADARENPGFSKMVLSDLLSRAAPSVNERVDVASAEWRKAHGQQ